jgi:hypothetical protein
MQRRLGVAAVVIAGILVASGAGAAEGVSTPHGNTTVWFGTGLATGESESGAAFRFGVDQVLTGRLSLELAGSYLDRGPESEAWTGQLGLRLDLVGREERAVPYVALGGGLYRARFGLVASDPDRMNITCGGTGDCPYGGMPRFYRRRMSGYTDARWPEHRSFTDPMVAIGGGARWDATPRLVIIPDARALFVTGDGDTVTIGVFTLNVGYRF